MKVSRGFLRVSMLDKSRNSSADSAIFPVLLSISTKRRLQGLLSTFVLVCCMGGALHAQSVSGTLLGTVTDSTGAVVPHAQVIITLTGQDAVHTSVTNDSGNFTEPNLPPG